MTRRDLRWRAAGVALTAVSCAICLALDGSPPTIAFFPLALLGLPLAIHGKRVGQLLRSGWHGHRHTVDVVHAACVRRRTRRPNPVTPREVEGERRSEGRTAP